MGAEAYSTGGHVAFCQAPTLRIAAHEAAHAVQQRGGPDLIGGVGKEGDAYERSADEVADRVVAGRSAADLLSLDGYVHTSSPAAVQMRRLPRNPGELLKPGANLDARLAGMKILITRAEAELTPKDRAQVETILAGQSDFNKLAEAERLTRKVNAITEVRSDLKFGDPELIETGPRDIDTRNLQSIVSDADRVFDDILSGTYNEDLKQVFGERKVQDAREKYSNGRSWMNQLHVFNKIFTDRSGFWGAQAGRRYSEQRSCCFPGSSTIQRNFRPSR